MDSTGKSQPYPGIDPGWVYLFFYTHSNSITVLKEMFNSYSNAI